MQEQVFWQSTAGKLEFTGAKNCNLVGLEVVGELSHCCAREILAANGKISRLAYESQDEEHVRRSAYHRR